MPSFVESLGYIKCYSLINPRPVKSPSILSDTTVRRSAVDLEDLKPYSLILIAGVDGLSLGYPDNPALTPRKPSSAGFIFSYVGLNWVSWVLKKYEMGLAGLAEFKKIKVGFNWVFWISNTL